MEKTLVKSRMDAWGVLSCVTALALAAAMNGCVTAHVEYSLADVRPSSSGFAGQTLFIEKFKDSRYADKKSVSTYVHKFGMYGSHSGHRANETHTTGLRPTPEMSDYREIFKGVPYSPDTSYYCAPDRLYWVPNGPLTDMREMLARHIDATRVFRSVTTEEGAKCDYVLKLDAKRFISLKERRPVVDVVDILWTGFLFSSDEIFSARVEWSLVRVADGKVMASGLADIGSVESHHCYSARNKPFKLNNKAARQVGGRIVRDIVLAARAARPGAENR